MADQDQGSFLTGFSLGLFAGAAGFFLFGTKDGQKTRVKLQQEWAKARAELEKEGVLKEGKSVKEMLLEKIGVNSQPTKKTSKKKTASKKSSKRKFKGT